MCSSTCSLMGIAHSFLWVQKVYAAVKWTSAFLNDPAGSMNESERGEITLVLWEEWHWKMRWEVIAFALSFYPCVKLSSYWWKGLSVIFYWLCCICVCVGGLRKPVLSHNKMTAFVEPKKKCLPFLLSFSPYWPVLYANFISFHVPPCHLLWYDHYFFSSPLTNGLKLSSAVNLGPNSVISKCAHSKMERSHIVSKAVTASGGLLAVSFP